MESCNKTAKLFPCPAEFNLKRFLLGFLRIFVDNLDRRA